MLKTKTIVDPETFQPMIIIEVPLSVEMLQDCYSFNAMDAPSEIKRMLLELTEETIDDVILNHEWATQDKEWLKKKLSQVTIETKYDK